MASFVAHYIAGEMVLNRIESRYPVILSKSFKYKFLLGNLVPDSTRLKNLEMLERRKRRNLIQEEKQKNHFRSEERLNRCIQYPDLAQFLSLYGSLMKKDSSVLGYFFHLYTDKIFFEHLCSQAFTFLDRNQNPTPYLDDSCLVKIEKNQNILTTGEFWDNPYLGLYHDYTLLNQVFLRHYGTSFDFYRLFSFLPNFINPGICEVDYQEVLPILEKMHEYCEREARFLDVRLNVFTLSSFFSFFPFVVEDFFQHYSPLIEEVMIEEGNQKKLSIP